MKGTRAALIPAMIAVAALLIVLPALAIGIGVAPIRFELADALRGEVYFHSLLLLNPGDQEAEYALRSEGEAGEWISFQADRETAAAIHRVAVPAGGRTQIAVRFAIPATATDGKHKASIVVELAPEAGQVGSESGQGSQGGAAVVLRAQVDVTIEVTGTKVATEEPVSTPTEDREAVFSAYPPSYVEHVVQRGENLTRIGRRYGVSVQAIVEANGIRNPSLIYVGQRLRIPLPQAEPAPAAEAAATPTVTPERMDTPTPVPAPTAEPSPVTPESHEPQPALQVTPVVITAEDMQVAMAAMAQAWGCTPQVAVVGVVLCGSVVVRRRQRG